MPKERPHQRKLIEPARGVLSADIVYSSARFDLRVKVRFTLFGAALAGGVVGIVQILVG